MTKLEQNVITFDAEYSSIKKTLQQAVRNVYEKADSKNIDIVMEEFPDKELFHNYKWTVEVFVNLLENAIKYTNEFGYITIFMIPYEMYTSIIISDNGMGIPTDELTKIFARFYRGVKVQNIEGSGIGLYLSKIILEKENGYITVTSDYGKGSSFSVYLRNKS